MYIIFIETKTLLILIVGTRNPLVRCESYSIPHMDLRPWQEKKKD